jgi:glycosyltransferase involved in cell wall biosynthesis
VVFSCCGLDWKRSKWGRWAQSVIKVGEWLSAKATHARISVSNDIVDYYCKTYDSEMWYIPNGTAGVCSPKSSLSLAKFRLEPGKYFVFVGRLVPEKAVGEMIEAFQQAREQLPGIKLAIAGGTSATDHYVKLLKRQAAGDPAIVFTSYVYGETLAALYAHALAYISPSHLEGLPNAVLEAISYGTPVIVSDIKPHLEIVQPPGYTPTPASLWVFEMGNVKQLAVRLINFLKINAEQRIVIGKETKMAVCNYYSWDRVADCHALFYQQWHDGSEKYNQRRQYMKLVSSSSMLTVLSDISDEV